MNKKEHPQALQGALKLFLKILENIINSPSEQKFRNIKKANKTLQAKLFCLENIHQLIDLFGFEYDIANEVYYMPDRNVFKIFLIIPEIQDAVDLIDSKLISQEEYDK